MAEEPPPQLGNIRFVAVARKDGEKHVVASFLYWTDGNMKPPAYEAIAAKVLKADVEMPRLSIVDNDAGMVHYDSDDLCRYLVITETEYPQRLSFKFLEAVKTDFSSMFGVKVGAAQDGQLSKSAKKVFIKHCIAFDDPAKADKVAAVLAQANQVSSVMTENVELMIQNHASLTELEDKSHDLKEAGATFKKASTDLKKQQWWKNMKLMGILIGVSLLVIVVIVVLITAYV